MTDLSNPIFHDLDAARAALEAQRWPHGPWCPHCREANPDKIAKVEGKKRSHRPGLHYCNTCKGTFTVTVGTVFERSKVPLTKWWMAVHLLGASKKGMSAHQLHRMLGVTYKTAWFMAHRIREAMDDSKANADIPMGGEGKAILADETYYGRSKKSKFYKKGHRHLWSIVALVDPDTGEARTFHVKSANRPTVRDILVKNASRKSILVTDDAYLYRRIGPEFEAHKTVKHSINRYVTDDGFTTNPVETFFSIFKRGMRGVYQHCGEQHLQRYLHEFDFRYTHRKITDAERAGAIMKGAEGKRLTYRSPNQAAHA